MDVVNRGFLLIKPKKAFFEWASLIDQQIVFTEEDDVESTCFLIEEDFIEIEPIIEKNFKKMFKHELGMISEDQTAWPPVTMEVFLVWFSVSIGSFVLDLEKTDLKRSKMES